MLATLISLFTACVINTQPPILASYDPYQYHQPETETVNAVMIDENGDVSLIQETYHNNDE